MIISRSEAEAGSAFGHANVLHKALAETGIEANVVWCGRWTFAVESTAASKRFWTVTVFSDLEAGRGRYSEPTMKKPTSKVEDIVRHLQKKLG